MDLGKVRRYSAQRFEEIRRHFALASQSSDPEAIHQMRVEIKRLKAFFQLLEGLCADFRAKKNLKPIRPIFKSAGRLRDLQLQIGLARQWMDDSGRDLEAFCQHLAEREQQAQLGFRKKSSLFDAAAIEAKEERVSRVLGSLTARQSRLRAAELLEGLQSELLERGQASKAQDDLHPLRILAKQARHTAELLQMCLRTSPPPNQVLEALRAAEQALGQWHDQEVALGFVEAFRQESETSSACQDYKEALSTKKRELHRAFFQLLPALKSALGYPSHH
ncbi:MAG: CHAD domain-containing protein [Acidobacteriota bacterium]